MEAGDAAEWLLHAESDLTYAKLGQAEPAILRNQVTFHAEQAAEKAFKAVLVHAAVEFPKTHDLQALLLLLRNSGISVGQEIEQAATLTRFAVEARYPGEIEPITPEEVAQAIELAERSLTWARVQIYEVSGPGEHSKPCASLLKATRLKESEIAGRQMRVFKEAQARYCPDRSATGTYRWPCNPNFHVARVESWLSTTHIQSPYELLALALQTCLLACWHH